MSYLWSQWQSWLYIFGFFYYEQNNETEYFIFIIVKIVPYVSIKINRVSFYIGTISFIKK
jgi:hypothetical protein